MPSRELLTRARHDLRAFAELIGAPLPSDAQVEAMAFEAPVTVLKVPRQAGKSYALALKVLHEATRRPGLQVLLVSATELSSRRLLREVQRLAFASPLLAVDLVDEQAALLSLSNGAAIRSVPASEGQIRGWSIDLLVVDEAAQVDDDLILGAALPTTAARPDARVVLASSPLFDRGAFFDYWTRGVNGSPSVRSFAWGYAEAPWVRADAIAALREGMPARLAAAELDGDFMTAGAGDALIDAAWIRDAHARRLPLGAAGVLGVDVARFGGDRTALYLNRGGRVRRVDVGTGWATTTTTARVREALASTRSDAGPPAERQQTIVLRQAHGLSMQLSRPVPEVLAAFGDSPGAADRVELGVIVDDTGVGGGVTDQLRAAGEPAVAFVSAHRARRPERFANRRSECFWSMREAFERGEVDIDPDDRALADQLRGLRFGFDARGRTLIESKDGMRRRGVSSPDMADAVCMTFDSEAWRPVEPVDPVEEHWRRADAAARRRARLAELGGAPESGTAPDGSLTGDLMTEEM